jgi:hypothetical protein
VIKDGEKTFNHDWERRKRFQKNGLGDDKAEQSMGFSRLVRDFWSKNFLATFF